MSVADKLIEKSLIARRSNIDRLLTEILDGVSPDDIKNYGEIEVKGKTERYLYRGICFLSVTGSFDGNEFSWKYEHITKEQLQNELERAGRIV